MNAWEPIETAPKDGTRILVVVSEQIYPKGRVTTARWMLTGPSGRRQSRGGFWRECGWNAVHATHWMPLPALPAVDEGAADPARGKSADASPAIGSAHGIPVL